MTNPEDINPPTVTTQPADLPSVSPKPGWQTSEGQIVAVIGTALTLLSFIGYHFTPEQTQGVYDLVHSIFVVLGPIVAFIPILIAYINSRGKQKSNAINATALMNMPSGFSGAMALGGLGSILGGKNWKDPSRYLNILKDVAATGIIPGPAGTVIGKIGGAASGTDDEFKQEVTNALTALDARLKALEAK